MSNGSGQVKFEGNGSGNQQAEPGSQQNSTNQNVQDFKKVKGNKEGNKVAREAGYKDAHDLKESTLDTDKGLDRFDIYKDSKTGNLEIRTKDEKVRMPVARKNK